MFELKEYKNYYHKSIIGARQPETRNQKPETLSCP
jgi:hypothetical protein